MKIFLYAALVLIAFLAGIMVGRASLTVPYMANLPTHASETNAETTEYVQEATDDTVVIPTSTLSESQKKMLSALGIDASRLVITPAMIACAESKLGAARLKEIEKGATPSMSEGFSLLACYQ